MNSRGIETHDGKVIIPSDAVFLDPPKNLKELDLSKDVFIVHGRDHKPVQELKMMLFEFGLNPIILHDLPDKGRTIIEKLEQEARGKGYAFVILTPDDVGCLETERSILKSLFRKIIRRPIMVMDREAKQILDSLKPRARQNVVLEVGLFMGLIGRERVCCLLKGKVERPSDMVGIIYKEFTDSLKDIRIEIMRELKAAGYDIKI